MVLPPQSTVLLEIVAPALHSELPPVLVEPLELLELFVGGVELVVPPEPEPDFDIEHSFTDFEGMGSEPKVDTEQLKLPLSTL